MFRVIFFLTLILSVFTLKINAQQNNKLNPRVGLVLSGGGAHGFAHIGVLELLDSLKIYPDYISGTSAGSLVGSMYAMGYSTKKMREIVEKQNWEKVLSNHIPLNFVSMEEKEDYGRFLLELPFDFKGIYLPNGIVEGENVFDVFAKACFNVVNVDSFKNFSIPFMCNATNIETGRSKTFETGYLPLTLRASMSVPTFFSPVLLEDDSIYTDGGTVHNFMARELKEKNIDYVIGSYTGMRLEKRDKLNSALMVLKQSATYQSYFDSRDQFDIPNIMIRPKTEKYSAFDFSSGLKLADIGKKTAYESLDTFKSLVSKLEKYNKKERKIIEKYKDSISIGCITHNHLFRTKSSFIWAKSGLKEHTSLSFDDFITAIRRLRGSMYYKSVYYSINPSKTNENDIKILLQENKKGSVRLAPHYNDVLGVGISVNAVMRNVFDKSSRLLFAVDIAEYPRAKLNYIKYVSVKQQNLIGIFTNYERNKLPFYDSTTLIKTYEEDRWNYELRWQYDINSNMALGTGFNQNFYTYRPNFVSSSEFFKKLSYIENSQRVFFQVNSLDKVYMPNNGALLDAEAKFVLNNASRTIYNGDTSNPPEHVFNKKFNIQNFVKFNINTEKYFSLYKNKIQWMAGSSIGGFFSAAINPFDAFWMGGIEKLNSKNIPFYGYKYSQVLAYNYVMLKSSISYQFDKNIYAFFALNAQMYDNVPRSFYKTFNDIAVDIKNENIGVAAGWAWGLVYISKLGPLKLIMNTNSEYSGINLNISIGHKF
jgi:NTE family protein